MSFIEELPNTYRPFFGRFPSLTEAQKALITPILEGRDVILQAGTGMGKTEAVLAPATERLIIDNEPFTILYIIPTKALALDMNHRIKSIYNQLGLKSGIRTGDGKTACRKKLHLLILTPESLDVFLGSQDPENHYFLKNVRVMIIDEVHIFLQCERGQQLSWLRRRLEMQTQRPLQTLAISATITGPEAIASFFSLRDPFYYRQSAARNLDPYWVHLKDENRELVPFFNDLVLRWKCKKLLVFANSRQKCEQLFNLLNKEGLFSQDVLLHYSNLSTKERRSIESSFKNKKTSVCIATSTLEMGIDIGDVDGVILIEPPPSAISFMQRIGRGNRRQQCVKFWGVCYGSEASRQLVRFLALFELAKDNQLEQCSRPSHYSVLFQQILSCLYAKKAVSKHFLSPLFQSDGLEAIVDDMLNKKWLKKVSETGLLHGGWRYGIALKNKKIWSNFPPSHEEYDVILEKEKIASLPILIVKQIEIGDIVQLTGKILKIVQIEEKNTYREVLVQESELPPTKELSWYGQGIPISFEAAQKIGQILINAHSCQGLSGRTQRLLENMQNHIAEAVFTSSGVLVHRLENESFRYETFLGTVGNFIIQQVMTAQFSSKIEGLSVRFDEMGIETNAWIPLESLTLPLSAEQFRQFVQSRLTILKQVFLWNSWLYRLPEDLQKGEIASRLLDMRVLGKFEQYRKTAPIIPPELTKEKAEETTKKISLKGSPWTIEEEKKLWEEFQPIAHPRETMVLESPLTASHIQKYVAQKLCPRLAHFQRHRFNTEIHPRFLLDQEEIHSQRQKRLDFQNQVLEKLQEKTPVRRATATFALKEAIEEVISTSQSLFLSQAALEIEHPRPMHGRPDLIYIKHAGSHIDLEVWDIKADLTVSYAQKLRIAFYAYLLDFLINENSFHMSVRISNLGGFVHPHVEPDKLFDRTHFLLIHFMKGIPGLISQWKMDSEQNGDCFRVDSSCTSCKYFSYCYQEMLFKESSAIENPCITYLGGESNNFPNNTQQWFFVVCNSEGMKWQSWEGDTSTDETSDYLQLQQAWSQSVERGKNPHFLVYETADWYMFQKFQKSFQHTSLNSPCRMHTCWTSIQAVLEQHFEWPFKGTLTQSQVARCLGLLTDAPPPLSLYHKESSFHFSLDLFREIWNWCLSHVKSRRKLVHNNPKIRSIPLINAYQAVVHRENEYRVHNVLEFQKKPLHERVENFRAIGPMTFISVAGLGRYQFSIDGNTPVSKFRVGDFMKFASADCSHIQDGATVVIESYFPDKGLLTIRSLSERIYPSKNRLYALDECANDMNMHKIEAVLNRMQDPSFRPELIRMLHGHGTHTHEASTCWIEQWINTHASAAGLNTMQKQALFLPFRNDIGLIEGPPGTGKTHLLVWTFIALCAYAKSRNHNIRILVTAQTHHAIDQILIKAARVLQETGLQETGLDKISLWKHGRYDPGRFAHLGIQSLEDSKTLIQNTSLVVGATGYGIYQLLEKANFPRLFDWVIFDESSQVLPAYALLSLIFGKGRALFYGDTQQLPPVVMGDYAHTSIAPRSILQELISSSNPERRLRLNETYRMNDTICQFAARHWYENHLFSVVPADRQRLYLANYPLFGDSLDNDLDPAKAMVVVELDHTDRQQSSPEEAAWIARAVKRLIQDYSVLIEEIGIISPHRLQNNTILHALKEALPHSVQLPKIDTVERMQGAEFDIVIFSATVSAIEGVHSSFLKDYRRFNVALTRARKKFIFVAGTPFFHTFPKTEKELIAHFSFDDFFLTHIM